jgi:ATP-dependent Lhr-like helicase
MGILNEAQMTKWLDELTEKARITYIEPGLWIAAEQLAEYTEALGQEGDDAEGDSREMLAINVRGDSVCDDEKEIGHVSRLQDIIRRMLYYRGAMNIEQISERYFLPPELINEVLTVLCDEEKIVGDDGIYYHSKRYTRAQKATIFGLRAQAVTRPGEAYAALVAARVERNASPAEQLELAIKQYCGQAFPAALWESVILPRRVKGYRENLLDQFLAAGEYFWRFDGNGQLCFERYEDIDWQQDGDNSLVSSDSYYVNYGSLAEDEILIYQELKNRGASFMRAFNDLPLKGTAQEGLLSLAEKGLVCADSFLPVRQWLNQDKLKKATPRARVNARMMALTTGRWDIVRPLKTKKTEDWLKQLFDRHVILCRDTYSRQSTAEDAADWRGALEILRIWEYTGRIRRGYFIAGMSGAQFIRAEEYDGVMVALGRYADDREKITWLNATDPAQVWGKALTSKDFMNISGTLVALHAGIPVMVLERQGKTLRIIDSPEGYNSANEHIYQDAMKELILLMKQKMVFPEKKRLTIKEYPPEIVPVLTEAGFRKEMMDYVWWR